MPGITLRKDGRYMIRKMVNGYRKTFYARTLTEAKRIETKLKKNKIEIKQDEEQNKYKNILVKNWIYEWENTYKKPFVIEKTFKDIHSCLKQVFVRLGNLRLNSLTTNKIQIFLNELPKNRTKERMQTYLNAILQKAEDLGIINKNPFKAVIKEKKGVYKHNCFSFEEQTKIINAVKGTSIEHEIFTYLMTGCRPAEFPNNECFDFKKNIIHIYGTKNNKSKHREIEMSQKFSEYMEEYLATNTIKSYEYIVKEFKRITQNLNIKNAILYRLRHTFASNHYKLGTPIKQVSEWLGHSTIDITLDVYTDIDKTASKEKIIALYNNYYILPPV